MPTPPDVTPVVKAAQGLLDNVSRVMIGKERVVELCLVALLCEGHVLIEDVPGIGKTTLAKAIARSLGCSFRRIQFTPDLLPSDVTGVLYFNQKTQEFEFRPGPLIAQIVLADEINRATPRTQSALLEAMQERQVTVDVETIPLPRPFLVLATQNPIELEGTFPLPEAQLDRFLMRISIGYPSEKEEGEILLRYERDDPLESLQAVLDADELLALQRRVREVLVVESVRDYIVRIARATREHEAIELGVSPRGAMSLYRTAQALAALRGRPFVTPDDVKELVAPVLSHRIIVNPQARLRGRRPADVLGSVLAALPVPVEAG
jgi:MoxR-like ATPase